MVKRDMRRGKTIKRFKKKKKHNFTIYPVKQLANKEGAELELCDHVCWCRSASIPLHFEPAGGDVERNGPS